MTDLLDPLRWTVRFGWLLGSRGWHVVSRLARHLWGDGFIHAGNLAYLSLLTLFPFFIIVGAVAGMLGQTTDGMQAIDTFLRALPRDVAVLLESPVNDVLARRSQSGLLGIGIVVGLWSVGSFIETMRDIIRRSYDITVERPFWQYRLGSIALIVASVILMLAAFGSQVVLTGAEEFVAHNLPRAADLLSLLGVTRLIPVLALFVALYLLFLTLTPAEAGRCPKWPGAALTTAVCVLTTMLLPWALSKLLPYDMTYGSLAGVMITLVFFWIVGLGFVLGAEFNAALAESAKTRQKGADATA